jgi:DNA-binding NtrC family response regulator
MAKLLAKEGSGQMTPPGPIRKPVAQTIAVLSVSSAEEDHFHLQDIFSSPSRTLYPDVGFTMTAKSSIAAAKSALQRGRISIVMCEHDLSPGSWKELLDFVQRLPEPPPVIVTSRMADERMWAEVLNLGGYDVLAKPLNSEEVIRTLTSAWSLWQHRFQCRAETSRKVGGNAA